MAARSNPDRGAACALGPGARGRRGLADPSSVRGAIRLKRAPDIEGRARRTRAGGPEPLAPRPKEGALGRPGFTAGAATRGGALREGDPDRSPASAERDVGAVGGIEDGWDGRRRRGLIAHRAGITEVWRPRRRDATAARPGATAADPVGSGLP